MRPPDRLLEILKRLSAGLLEPHDWLEWWEANSDWVADHLNRGQWLRLKPKRPGGFGPPSRCTLLSQQAAFNLLTGWGIEHEQSDRYEREWKTDFEKHVAETKRVQRSFRPQLDSLQNSFPNLTSFLIGHIDEITELGEPALEGRIQQLELALETKLPASYCKFLSCTSLLVFKDVVQIGLPCTFRHPLDPQLPSAGRICFGEYWLEGDGDQILFGDADPSAEPPVLYYNHSRPSIRILADDFETWVEAIGHSLKG